jgi:hypothetical protein
VPEQQGDLSIRELEDRPGHTLFVRSLVPDTELSKPEVDSGGVPAIAVSSENELVPASAALVPRRLHTEFGRRGVSHDAAIFLGARGVAQRLMPEVAAMTDEVPEQNDPRIGPLANGRGLGQFSSDRQTIAGDDRRHARPAR